MIVGTEESRQSSWTSSLWIFAVYLIPYTVLSAIALYWPALSAPFGIDLTDCWLTRMVPSVAGYISKSQFPHATSAYFVFSAILFLPYLIAGIMNPVAVLYFGSYRRMRAYEAKFRSRPLLARLFIILANIGFIYIAWAQPGYQFGLLPLHEERWALALGGPLFSFYSASYFFVSGIVMSIRFLLEPSFERNHHGME